MNQILLRKYNSTLLNEVELWELLAPYTSNKLKAEKIAEVVHCEPELAEQAIEDYQNNHY